MMEKKSINQSFGSAYYASQIVVENAYLLFGCETVCPHVVAEFNWNIVVPQIAKDLIDFANLFFVLQENRRIEIWNILNLYFTH